MGPGTKYPAEKIKKQNLSDIFKFMADEGAGFARGVTRGTLGLPGDLESLVRLGIGGQQALPTSEDFNKILPPLRGMLPAPNGNPYDTIGMYYNVPIYGKAGNSLVSGTKKFMGKEIPHNASRRNFSKQVAIGGGALLAAPILKLSKAIEHTAPLAKQAEDLAPAVKAVSRHKFNSLKEYNDYLNSWEKGGILNNQGPGMKRFIANLEEQHYNNAKTRKPELLRNNKYLTEETINSRLTEFSPQAKAEMKAFKQQYGQPDPSDFAHGTVGPHWSDFLDDYVKGL